MATGTRQRMIDGAVRLLATRGLQGASIGEVLDATGTPRGSVYHHFPDGKSELIAAALDQAGRQAIETLAAHRGEPPVQVVAAFLDRWRRLLVGAQFRAGCSVVAVTVAADDDVLLGAARTVFSSWADDLAELLRLGGTAPEAAASFAVLLLAATEGAVVLSRAQQSIDPFETVAAGLIEQARRLPTDPG
jgi:AcrR family transcriptional regulator